MSLKINLSYEIRTSINEFNEKNEVKLPNLEKLAEKILGNVTTRDEETRKFIVSQIISETAKDTLGYFLGVSKILPNSMSEEIKLKYGLLNSVSADALGVQGLITAFNRLPPDKREEIVGRLLKALDNKKTNSAHDLVDLLQLLGQRPFEEREQVFTDIEKLMSLKSFKPSETECADGLILLLKDIFENARGKWAQVMECICYAAEKGAALSLFDLNWCFESLIKFSQKEEWKEEWKEVMDQAFKLINNLDSSHSMFSIVKTMRPLFDVSRISRPKLIEVLSHLKGAREYYDLLIPVFLAIPQAEWTEILQPSLSLFNDNTCDNYLMVRSVAKCAPGERGHVAKLTNQFVNDLHKEKIYGSEKAILIEAASQVLPDSRSSILTLILNVYDVMQKTYQRELNGCELARLIQALATASPGEESQVIAILLSQLTQEIYVSEIDELIRVLAQNPQANLSDLKDKWARIREESAS
jgi:hypothetical protein